MGEVLSADELAERIARHKSRGEVVAFANGAFDLLHVGHARYLAAARAAGDLLVVAVNDDESVRRLKGDGRPVVPAAERAELVAALAAVDYVTLFAEDTPAELLRRLQPDLHCKGTDYGTPDKVPEYEVVRAYGGRTVLVGDPKDHSTTELIDAVRKQ